LCDLFLLEKYLRQGGPSINRGRLQRQSLS
jgi:hypothetical protein